MFDEANRRYPHYALFQLNSAKVKIKTGEWHTALVLLDKILSRVPDHLPALSLKGQVLLKQEKYAESIDCYRQFLDQKPNDPIALLQAGIGLRGMGNLKRAKWYLEAAQRRHPGNIPALLWLIETNLLLENRRAADAYLDNLLARLSYDALILEMQKIRDDSVMPSASQKMITQEITLKLKAQSAAIAQLDNR
jgi:predicted Zn-dependent protease